MAGTSNEGIWSQKIPNFMQGLTRAILAYFHNGMGWPCPVIVAIKNPSQEYKNL